MTASRSQGGMAPLLLGAAVVAALLFFGLFKGSDNPDEGAIEPAPATAPGATADAGMAVQVPSPEAPGDSGDGVEFIAREDLKVEGYGVPDRAVRSYLAALVSNDVEAMADALIPEKAEEFRNLMSVPSLSGDILRGMTNSPILRRSGVRMVGRDRVSEDEMKVMIRFGSLEEAETNDVTTVFTLKRVAGDWKIADSRRAE